MQVGVWSWRCLWCIWDLLLPRPQVRLPHLWSRASHSCFQQTGYKQTYTSNESLTIWRLFPRLKISFFNIPGRSSGGPSQWSLPQWTSLVKQTGPGRAWRCGPETQGEWWAALARLHSDYGTEAEKRDKTSSIFTYLKSDQIQSKLICTAYFKTTKLTKVLYMKQAVHVKLSQTRWVVTSQKDAVSDLLQKSAPAALPCCWR